MSSIRDESPATSVKERTVLCDAGLGDGVVTFNLLEESNNFHQKLVEKFPKLSEAVYELMLYQRGKDAAFHTLKPPYTPSRLKEMCGQAKIYIRPLQNNLPVDVISILDDVTTHEGKSRKVISPYFIYGWTIKKYGEEG